MVQYVIRRWNCLVCGRHNATEVSLDGTGKCDHCATVTRIQPSQARGGETPAELAARWFESGRIEHSAEAGQEQN